ncbi:hypothetical protein EDE08_106402 [Bradyrhizobium sp. R2.2-H]|nr:hypothetical protein EDE10_1064 [Bradyrhizobium sp. Y-H1]TCU73342.1 hypothetical protein EDE08_106402 [Bradyrhizobium sp. R2.2-H]
MRNRPPSDKSDIEIEQSEIHREIADEECGQILSVAVRGEHGSNEADKAEQKQPVRKSDPGSIGQQRHSAQEGENQHTESAEGSGDGKPDNGLRYAIIEQLFGGRTATDCR